MGAVEASGVATRDPELVLARLHLRLGSLALARAELETLAGRDALDEDGLVDLAEARWRTGDIAGAGEAAVAALHDEDGPLLALVVAAEAAAARGRPTEARRLADKAMERAAGSIDALFAGMPRAVVWPPDAAAPPPSPTTMFEAPRRATSAVHRHPRPHEESVDAAGTGAIGTEELTRAARSADVDAGADAATIGLWEATGLGSATELAADLTVDIEAEAEFDAATDLPAGDVELDLGRAALESNDLDEAVVRFGLVLRVAPALAPAVLDLVEGRTERGMALVRGDAYRLVGRELDARRAFVEAARGVPSLPTVADDQVVADDHSSDPDDPPVQPEAAAEPDHGDPYDHASEGDPA